MFRDVQDEIKELLQGDPYFSDVAGIVSRRKGSIVEQVQEALAVLSPNASGKSGLAIIVVIPDAINEKPNVPGPFFGTLKPSVIILENPTLNTIGKSADEASEYVAAVLHQRLLDSTGNTLLVMRKVAFVASKEDPDAPVGYEVMCEAVGGLEYQPEQVATPELEAA